MIKHRKEGEADSGPALCEGSNVAEPRSELCMCDPYEQPIWIDEACTIHNPPGPSVVERLEHGVGNITDLGHRYNSDSIVREKVLQVQQVLLDAITEIERLRNVVDDKRHECTAAWTENEKLRAEALDATSMTTPKIGADERESSTYDLP